VLLEHCLCSKVRLLTEVRPLHNRAYLHPQTLAPQLPSLLQLIFFFFSSLGSLTRGINSLPSFLTLSLAEHTELRRS
jgi:hypothetical protein